MKTNLFLMLITLLVSSLGLSSCDNNKEIADGDWPPMKWETKTKMKEEKSGVFKIQTLKEGGTYLFTCTNYHPSISNVFCNASLVNSSKKNFYEGEWGSVSMNNNVLKVILHPNSNSHGITLHIQLMAGDSACRFVFERTER